MKLILKSSSPRRKELLEAMGYPFEIKVYEVDETMDKSLSPYENVKRLGLKKASVCQEQDYGNILLGCDTIVVWKDCIFGKPKDEAEAYAMLKSLSGQNHSVLSGVGIIYKEKVYNFVVTSEVYFKNLSEEDIQNYLQTKEWVGKAGAYAIQGIGKNLIDHYEGSLTNIIGLPTEEVEKVLREIYEF